MNNAMPRSEIVGAIYRYHTRSRVRPQMFLSDPRWAELFLKSSVATGYISQEDADAIKLEVKGAVKR